MENDLSIQASMSSVFHPVWQRDSTAWFPGDEKTSALVAGEHIWDDICRLIKIRAQCTDEYERKLMLKYVCIELFSLVEVMDQLQAAVMTAETYKVDTKPVWRGISTEERDVAKKLWTDYSAAKKQVEKDLVNIRHKIAAHRHFSYNSKKIEGVTGWHLVMLLWDRLELELFKGLLTSIPPAFNHAKSLDIYEWNREPETGVIEFYAGRLTKWDFMDPEKSEHENEI